MDRMKTLSSLLVAGVAALVATPAGAVDLSVPGTGYWFIGEDFDGNLIVRELPESEPAADHLGGCIGFSPQVNACSTGTHEPSGPLNGFNLIHGFLLLCRPAGIVVQQVVNCYVGRQTSQVTDGVHMRTFSCDILTPWQLPSIGVACAGGGTFPTTTFTHTCTSKGYGTVVPVAVGDWSCVMISH